MENYNDFKKKKEWVMFTSLFFSIKLGNFASVNVMKTILYNIKKDFIGYIALYSFSITKITLPSI